MSKDTIHRSSNQGDSLPLNVEDLDPTTIIALDALSAIAKRMNIDQDKYSSYETGLTHTLMTTMDLELERQDLEELSWVVQKRKILAERELAALKELWSCMRQQRDEKEQPQVQQWQKETSTIKAQLEQDAHEYEKAMEQIKSRKDDTDVTAVSLLEQQTYQLEKQLDKTTQHLSQYNNLPADMDLATTMLQDKLDDSTKLERTRDRLLADIASSMY
ncbi:uncharacterized protein BX664DRAFT_46031 [Halteromyces radiatus]|uniref:uncharacterized protein n=1 Tax=Halteromyces radiatus TaxID=101107 RepID=UPI002220E44E|nr:uncharacterized protein BX664DRAFT_46031 [Halteromyces radiatus]KAI8076738.1 hypothetical protein BX664DRAFT_46031 [Halteromyces radiatus]